MVAESELCGYLLSKAFVLYIDQTKQHTDDKNTRLSLNHDKHVITVTRYINGTIEYNMYMCHTQIFGIFNSFGSLM